MSDQPIVIPEGDETVIYEFTGDPRLGSGIAGVAGRNLTAFDLAGYPVSLQLDIYRNSESPHAVFTKVADFPRGLGDPVGRLVAAVGAGLDEGAPSNVPAALPTQAPGAAPVTAATPAADASSATPTTTTTTTTTAPPTPTSTTTEPPDGKSGKGAQ